MRGAWFRKVFSNPQENPSPLPVGKEGDSQGESVREGLTERDVNFAIAYLRGNASRMNWPRLDECADIMDALKQRAVL